jgi:hypothetical protein
MFYQLITITGYIFGRSYQLAFVFMSEESEYSYDRVFKKVVKITKITPEFIMIAFEMALQKNINKNILTRRFTVSCLILVISIQKN